MSFVSRRGRVKAAGRYWSISYLGTPTIQGNGSLIANFSTWYSSSTGSQFPTTSGAGYARVVGSGVHSTA
jgi:hypothetical protein